MDRRPSSSIQRDGVAAVLANVQAETIEWFQERLIDRSKKGRHSLSDEHIKLHSQAAGGFARKAAADGISEAYLLGQRGEHPVDSEWPAEHVRVAVVDQMTKYLIKWRNDEWHANQTNPIDDEEIVLQARIAGISAKTAAEDGIAQAHRWGVNSKATTEDHERKTTPAPGYSSVVVTKQDVPVIVPKKT